MCKTSYTTTSTTNNNNNNFATSVCDMGVSSTVVVDVTGYDAEDFPGCVMSQRLISKVLGFVGYTVQYGCIAHCMFQYIGEFVMVSSLNENCICFLYLQYKTHTGFLRSLKYVRRRYK